MPGRSLEEPERPDPKHKSWPPQREDGSTDWKAVGKTVGVIVSLIAGSGGVGAWAMSGGDAGGETLVEYRVGALETEAVNREAEDRWQSQVLTLMAQKWKIPLPPMPTPLPPREAKR